MLSRRGMLLGSSFVVAMALIAPVPGLAQGANILVTTIPGRYVYFCIPHEQDGMIGEVIVE